MTADALTPFNQRTSPALSTRHDLRRLKNLARNTRKLTTAFAATQSTPFGNSIQFSDVGFVDQVNSVSPPSFTVPGFLPSAADVASNGLTIELWFKAESGGILVGQPLIPTYEQNNQLNVCETTPPVAPLLYIDGNGCLRGGLFDSTISLNLFLPLISPLLAYDANKNLVVAPLNALSSPLSVIDGDWHHAALVVVPGTTGSQSLYLDGRLAATAAGNFALSFSAQSFACNTSNGSMTAPWALSPPQNAATQFGGNIDALLPSHPTFFPYPPGFCGTINELRSWNASLSPKSIQQRMAQPLGANSSQYEQQGLVGYLGATQLASLPTGNYLSLVSDGPPIDPFPSVINLIPGCQNYGTFTAIPFSAPAVDWVFQPFEVYCTKISLRQGDSLQISFPSADSHHDNLEGEFSLAVTTGPTGITQSASGLAPGQTFTVTAPLTGTYRLIIGYSGTSASTLPLQFMMVPGPNNTLMQLLLDIEPQQMAYTDPNYPLAECSTTDPRNSQKSVTLFPYWPCFTDATAFPIAPDAKYKACDLLVSYLDLCDGVTAQLKSGQLKGSTFADFFNLFYNNATIVDPDELQKYLDASYVYKTRQPKPAIVPIAPFSSPCDQVYAFITNANTMRRTVCGFLTNYQKWASAIMNTIALLNVPSSIATNIYNEQSHIDAEIKGPSTGDFITNLLLGSAIIGLGAIAAPLLLTPFGAVEILPLALGVGAVGGAGANILSELLGTFLNSQSLKTSYKSVSYTTLEDVVINVDKDLSTAYQTVVSNLLNDCYLKAIYSNYGLLQALQFLNTQALSDSENRILNPPDQTNNALSIGATYTSWQALIPSVFTWVPRAWDQFKQKDGGYQATSLSMDATDAREFSLNEAFKHDQDLFWNMLADLQDWQQLSKNPEHSGQFFSTVPVGYGHEISPSDFMVGGWTINWGLRDQQNNIISPQLVNSLFGVGGKDQVLSLADQNNPVAAAAYGWYLNAVRSNNGVTTPFDVFMNWGPGLPSYSPRILLSQWEKYYPEILQKHSTGSENGYIRAFAADDLPPSALVTLAPDELNFGILPISFPSLTQNIVLTNNQQDPLKDVTVINNYPSDFTVGGIPTELNAGSSVAIPVTFAPQSTGNKSGSFSITAKSDNGPLTLTANFSGAAANAGRISLTGDPSVWSKVKVWIYSDGAEAAANWNTGQNSLGMVQLEQGAQWNGVPSCYLAGVGTGSQPEIFMVINYLNDVPLQFGADGNQVTAIVPGVNLPANGNGPGSITWNGDSYGDVWASGIVYSIFDNLDAALQNYTTGSGAKVTGQLGGSSGTNTAGNLPSGWLAVYCPGNQQLYVLTQYFSEFAAIMTPFYGQAVFYIQ